MMISGFFRMIYERYHTDYERYEQFYERYQSPMKKDLTLRIRGGQGLFNYRTV